MNQRFIGTKNDYQAVQYVITLKDNNHDWTAYPECLRVSRERKCMLSFQKVLNPLVRRYTEVIRINISQNCAYRDELSERTSPSFELKMNKRIGIGIPVQWIRS